MLEKCVSSNLKIALKQNIDCSAGVFTRRTRVLNVFLEISLESKENTEITFSGIVNDVFVTLNTNSAKNVSIETIDLC